MKNLFNLDNPVMQTLARIGDLMILSVITLTLCLPVVTFGPAVTALFKTVYSLTLDACGGTVATYFKAFKANFKQSLIVGIAMEVALTAFACDFYLVRLYYAGTAYQVLLALIVILVLFVMSIMAYMFPLISRYQNTLKEHMRNAAILTVIHLPRTLLSVLIHFSPIIMLIFRGEFMLQTLVVWIFLAPGLIAQADSYILMPVFKELENLKEAAGEDEKDCEE